MTITRYEGGSGGEDLLPGLEIPKVSPMIELGATGLRRTGGIIDEEFLPQLRGRKAIQIYREMADNDPVVGALLFSVDRLLRQVEWRVEPADSTPDQKQAAEFIEQCMEDMSYTWDDTLTEILTMLPFGWSWHEIVYKRRVGPWEKDPAKRSKYTDNKIGWRKIPIRAQETWTRWIFDDTGGVKGMVQMAPPYYKQVVLPIEKSLLFRVSTAKNNPEGRSFLRNAYRPWYMKKRLEEIEGIGAERDLAGLPMARVPADYLNAPKGTDKEKMVEAFRKMVRSVRRNEQEGVIIPRQVDQDTKMDLFDFALLGSGGSRQFNINEIITRYEQRILMTVLADFILVGHEQTGSYALHTDKTGLFRASMNSIAQMIADVFNRYAIPRLFEVNGWKLDQLPQIVPGDIDPPDLTQLSGFMGQLASAGITWFPDPELEKFLRQAARLPKLDESVEQIKEAEARQANIMRLAEQRMQMLTMSQQAEQGAMGMAQQEHQVEQGRIAAEQAGIAHQTFADQHAMQLTQQAQAIEGTQRQLDAPQQDPMVQQARDDEMHQMALSEKQQGMDMRAQQHEVDLKTKQALAEQQIKDAQAGSQAKQALTAQQIKDAQSQSKFKLRAMEEGHRHKLGTEKEKSKLTLAQLKARANEKKTPPKKESK